MTPSRQRGETRTGLRKEEQHASWREVYFALGVDPEAHEQTWEESDVVIIEEVDE